MCSFIRRSCFVLPSLFALAALTACGAPPGEDAGSDGAEALSIGPIHPVIPPIGTAWVAPSYYASALSSLVKMQSSTTSVCLLQGVDGIYSGLSNPSMVARIITSGGYYYLQTSGGVQASAACAPLTNFSGVNTEPGTFGSTVNAPYYVSASHPQNATGFTQNQLTLWGTATMCVLSGLAGDWSGLDTGAVPTMPVLQTWITGGNDDFIATNGPGITSYADCFQFAQRTSVTSTTVSTTESNTTTVALPNVSVGLCGLVEYIGTLNVGDGANVRQSGNAQSLQLSGLTVNAAATCMLYQQQGS